MFLLLAVTYTGFVLRAFSLPTGNKTLGPLEGGVYSQNNYAVPLSGRTVWDVVWSCLATIFACTWVSVHPNIPDPDDSIFSIAARRMKMMFWALIAPELVVCWAMRQKFGAQDIAKKYKERGWTISHGHFLQMGGFLLVKSEAPVETLSFETFDQLLTESRIDWPSITKQEIEDKSKGDWFSKGLAIFQTSWFVLQCITRVSQKLSITPLEVTTLALASFNIVMYYLWWDKPLDVRSPIHVHLKDGPGSKIQPLAASLTPLDGWKQESKSDSSAPLCDIVLEMRSVSEWKARELPPSQQNGTSSFKVSAYKHAVRRINTSLDQIHRDIDERGIWWMLYKLIIYIPILRPVEELATNISTIEPHAKRVPTFYAIPAELDEGSSVAWSYFNAFIFGAIHIISWWLHFPTKAEEILSLSSSILVIVTPAMCVYLLFMDVPTLGDFPPRNALVIVGLSGMILYVLAHLLLISLSFLSLRDLSPQLLTAIQWTNYLPHI